MEILRNLARRKLRSTLTDESPARLGEPVA